MSYGVRLHVWGDYACFTRPEMKVERVSYDVITPSAARGILEAIYWKPAIRWRISKIHVLKPIRFESIQRNEVGVKASAATIASAMKAKSTNDLYILVDEHRQQRAATVLKDVAYVIEAHFDLTSKAGEQDNPTKHIEQFKRRALKGQCFHQPCLGTREFPAHFALLEGDVMPSSTLTETGKNRELGWMLHDIDFHLGNTPHFFKAKLIDGIIDVPAFDSSELRA